MDFFKPEDSDMSYRDAMHVKGITIEKANRLLRERSEKVFAHISRAISFSNGPDVVDNWSSIKQDTHEYQALLINIESIEQDSAKKILKEWVDYLTIRVPQVEDTEFIKRAKRLLEKK